jgi:hypothetical protein
MRHNLRQRTAAGLLALLAQTGLIAPFMQSHEQTSEDATESMRLVFIQPMQIQMLDVPPPRQLRTPAANRTPDSTMIATRDRVEPIAPVVPVESVEPSETSRTITVKPAAAPRIDWYRQMAIAARRAAEQQEDLARDNPLNSKPRVLVLPTDRGAKTAPLAPTRMDNGDLVTEHRPRENVSVKCLHEHTPLAELFDVTAPHRLPRCSTHDTSPSLEPLVESAKPDYLRRPLPLPKPAQTRGESPESSPANR